jgi:hypothetical protein
MIDADTLTVLQRHEQLDRALEGTGLTRRQSDEKIALLVPKRNIETWIHYLRKEQVNEEQIYRKLEKPGECKPFVKELAEAPPNTPLVVEAPPALKMAIDEMQIIV